MVRFSWLQMPIRLGSPQDKFHPLDMYGHAIADLALRHGCGFEAVERY